MERIEGSGSSLDGKYEIVSGYFYDMFGEQYKNTDDYGLFAEADGDDFWFTMANCFTFTADGDCTITANFAKIKTSADKSESKQDLKPLSSAVIDRYLASPNCVVAVSANVSGGGVSVSKKTVYRGSTVIITVTPEEGKALSKLTVTDDEGEAVTVKKLYGNKYYISMYNHL